MKILPVSQRKAFDCNGKRYVPFGQIYPQELTPRRIRTPDKGGRTPLAYPQSLFFALFPDNIGAPLVFLDGDCPVVFLAGMVYDYIPAKPLPPLGLLRMQPTETEYEATEAGTEYLIRLQSDDTPPQAWCRYEFIEPGERRFLVTAPTVDDCRIYRDLWLREQAISKS